MADQPLRYGIIGAGVIANYMARVFTEGRGSVAVAVSDVNPEAARKLATTCGECEENLRGLPSVAR